MLRHLSILFTIFSCSALLFSCEEPLQEELVPDIPSKLVVESNFSEGRPIVVTVSKSGSVRDTSGYYGFLTNAEVDLYWKDEFLERLSLVLPKKDEGPPYYRSWNYTPVANVEYSIRVSADGYETVMAKSMVPSSVKITYFDLDKLWIEPPSTIEVVRHRFGATVDFDDPVSSRNFYHLNVRQQINNFVVEGKDTLITKTLLKSVSFDPSQNQNDISAHLGGGLLFEDKPGDKPLSFSFVIELDSTYQLFGKTYLELRTLSSDYYFHYTTLSRHAQGGNQNPLFEPVTVYENIENGHGIFAGYSNTLDSIQLIQ